MHNTIKCLPVALLAFTIQFLFAFEKPEAESIRVQLIPYWQEKTAGLIFQYPGPFWSPDSRYVCFQTLAAGSKALRPIAELVVVDVPNKKVVWNSANHAKRQNLPGRKQVIDVKWLKEPDGLVWIESTGDVWRANLVSGELQHVARLNGLFEVSDNIFLSRKQSAFISRNSTHLYYFQVRKPNILSLRRVDYSNPVKDEELWSSRHSKYVYMDSNSWMVISLVAELSNKKVVFILNGKGENFPRYIVHVLNLEKPAEVDVTPVPAPGTFILHEATLLEDSMTLLLTGLANDGNEETDPDYCAVYTYNLVSKQLTLRIKGQDSVLANWRILHPERLLMVLVCREEKKDDEFQYRNFTRVYNTDLTKPLLEIPMVDYVPEDYSLSPCGNYIAQACINKNFGLAIQRIVRLKK